MPSAIRVIDQASEIVADTSNFDGILGGGDSDVQTALETLDDFSADPGGSNKQVQYNNSTAFGGATGFEWQNASPNVSIIAQNAAHVPFLVKAAASQSANLTEIQDSSGNVLAGVDERGILFSNGGIHTDSVYIGNNVGNIAHTNALYNVAIGDDNLKSVTTGDSNVMIGWAAGEDLTAATHSVGIGAQALLNVTTGGLNTAVGYKALQLITTNTGNVAIGVNALQKTAANDNVGIGNNVMQENTSGTNNLALGTNSLKANTTGNSNMAIGINALILSATGDNNCAIGTSSLSSANGASNNVAIGRFAGAALTTGANNTFIGTQAGDNLTTGASNIIIGYGIEASAVDVSNELNIGGIIKGDVSANKLGFFQTAAITKPEVTGARDNTEAALADLLTELANLGLITDSTTAS